MMLKIIKFSGQRSVVKSETLIDNFNQMFLLVLLIFLCPVNCKNSYLMFLEYILVSVSLSQVMTIRYWQVNYLVS